MEVEFGVSRDIESWMDLVQAVRWNFPGLETEAALEEHRQTVLRFMEEHRALCVKDGDKVTGVLLLSKKHNMICCLAVAPAYRRKGIASALLNRALLELNRTKDIMVTTFREQDEKGIAPRALYKRFGFAEGKLLEEFGYPVQEFVLRGGSMRLFIALDLPETVKEALWENAALLRRHCAGGRVSPKENYHITLAFLGEQPESRISDLTDAMDDCAAGPFSVSLGGLGEFETGVVWRGIEGSAELERLQQTLTHQLRLRNVFLEERPFQPHLTLARRVILQEDVRLSDLSAQLSPLSFPVDRMILYRSELSHTGARYTPVCEKRLRTPV